MAAIILISCGSGKKFQATTSEDKSLFKAINELNKKPQNVRAQNDLQILYNNAVIRHEDAIEAYRAGTDEHRYDKILNELNALQHIYNSLQAVPGSFGIVKPKNYIREIEDTRNEAAEVFYVKGNDYFVMNGRENSLQANAYFKKSNDYVNGYKDVQELMKQSYDRSIVYVVINPIEDDNIYFSGLGSWGSTDFRYRPQDYQESLVRDLGGQSANYVPAKFYTDREIRRNDVDVDWEVDIRWRNIDPLRTTPNQYTRQVSKSIEIGRDTAKKPIYQTVYATLYITQRSYSVRGDLEYRITDLNERSTVDQGLVSDDVNWSESSATYTGDSRALSQDDWNLVNNRNYNNNVSRGDVLNSLMRRLYPDLRRRIQQSIY